MLDERCAQTELTADVITYKKICNVFVLPYRREEKKTCYAAATYVYIMWCLYICTSLLLSFFQFV